MSNLTIEDIKQEAERRGLKVSVRDAPALSRDQAAAALELIRLDQLREKFQHLGEGDADAR